ncbi:unnamed protein product [Brachionus calyciflorus]|uniref:Post-SET domain-containing protein n=1 Tax=Brachionus calyciflorus TaxID=104777 RepID=A0A813W0Y3_9BILA|nr:unnamed protein product [Brachionus calyciflorus]
MIFFPTILALSSLIGLANLAAVHKICPNENFCKCNWESKRIECFCKTDECRNALAINSHQTDKEKSLFKFTNKTYQQFKEIYINEVERIDQSFFINTLFSRDIKLSIQLSNIIGANLLANLTRIKNLEIIYTNLYLIEPNAFNYLTCETLSFISLGDNYEIDIKSFGDEAHIDSLVLDYHTSNYLKSLFINTSPGWKALKHQINLLNLVNYSLTKQQLNRYWSLPATIKKIYIQEVKGIKVLDHTFVPKFNSLEKIEIYFTDINQISPNFAILHSDNLKYLTIRQSNLEVIQSNIFGSLHKLEFLDLSSNPIKFFELNSFENTFNLKTLMLHSISEYYHVDYSDICMFSYLNCGVNVYLDSYVDSRKSCPHIFINELRNESSKFDFAMKESQFVEYSNARRDCKLKDELKSCLIKTNRNNHCLMKKTLFDESLEMVDLIVDVSLGTNKLTTTQAQLTKSLNDNFISVKISNESSNLKTDLKILENVLSFKSFKNNEWLIFTILILVLFCIIQFLAGIVLTYLYCSNRKNSIGCLREQVDSMPKTISIQRTNEFRTDENMLDQTGGSSESQFKKVVFARPKFVPRQPQSKDSIVNFRF